MNTEIDVIMKNPSPMLMTRECQEKICNKSNTECSSIRPTYIFSA